MSISKERFEESRKLIREHLVKSHNDKDDDSLFVRFSEIGQYIEDLIWEKDSWKRVGEAIKGKN